MADLDGHIWFPAVKYSCNSWLTGNVHIVGHTRHTQRNVAGSMCIAWPGAYLLLITNKY